MRPKNVAFSLFLNGERIQGHLPISEVEINVNGGYARWNRWWESALEPLPYFLGIDLCREATIVRNQSINCSTVPGTLISRLKGNKNG